MSIINLFAIGKTHFEEPRETRDGYVNFLIIKLSYIFNKNISYFDSQVYRSVFAILLIRKTSEKVNYRPYSFFYSREI